MKKKFLIVLLALISVLACTFGISACSTKPSDNGGNGQGDIQTPPEDKPNMGHTHSWSSTYTEDGDRHYQICDGCDEKQYLAHSYNADDVCICGKPKPAQGENKPPVHTHVYNKQVADAKYLKSEATCTAKAIFHVSCECGEQGTETFEYGDYAHTFNKQVAESKYLKSEATCTTKAVYYVSCECGEKGTEAFEYGEIAVDAHNYVNGECTVCHVAEQQPVTNADIIKFLDENCLDGIIKACHGSWDDKVSTWIYDGKWYVTKDANSNVVEASHLHVYRYQNEETNSYYYVGKVEFENPIDINNFNQDDLTNAKYTNCFHTDRYNSTIQGNKFLSGFNMDDDVDIDVVFEKLFGEKQDGAQRICTEIYVGIMGNVTREIHPFGKKFKDWGANKAGIIWQIHCFEIADNYIKTGTMYVCRDQNGVSDYKQLFYDYVNTDYYRTVITDKYDILGEHVPENNELFELGSPSKETLTDKQIFDALDNYYYSDVMATYRPQVAENSKWWNEVPAYSDKAGRINGKWYITKDKNGNVLKAEYLFDYKGLSYNTSNLNYNDSLNVYTYKCVYSLQFDSPFNYDDYQNLKQGIKKRVACHNQYKMLIGGGRPYEKQYESLCNTLCDTLIGHSENADIYLRVDVSGEDMGAKKTYIASLGKMMEVDDFCIVHIQDKTFTRLLVSIVKPSLGLGSYEKNVNAGLYNGSGSLTTFTISGELLIVE